WQDGNTSRFSSFWLRDHCRCPECRHSVTQQRLVDTVSLPADVAPSKLEPASGSTATKVNTGDYADAVSVTWSHGGHHSQFSSAWLRAHSYDPPVPAPASNANRQQQQAHQRISEVPIMHSDPARADAALAEWLASLERYGLAFVKGVPAHNAATEALVRRIAFVRETHYGGFWDFTSNLSHGDTAYTTLPLQSHTDTTYFTDPVGLQLFHLIEFDGEGGRSVFVDGFAAAEALRAKHPEAYQTLCDTKITTHSAGDEGVLVMPTPRYWPIFNFRKEDGELYQIRFNNDDRSVLDHLTRKQVDAFYDALRKWTLLLRDPKYEFQIQLEPGTVAIFNNWRVLHGRTSFVGHRRLTGAYV
ncbi:Trimethyllysine dioxygenase, partial [Ramicandelaber brevisporus]